MEIRSKDRSQLRQAIGPVQLTRPTVTFIHSVICMRSRCVLDNVELPFSATFVSNLDAKFWGNFLQFKIFAIVKISSLV